MHTITLDPAQHAYLMQVLTKEVRAGEEAEDRYRQLSDTHRTREAYYAVADAKNSSFMAQKILRELVTA